MKSRWNWKTVIAVRFSVALIALIGMAFLIQGEMAKGEELNRQIQAQELNAKTLIDQGRQVRIFRSQEEPKVLAVETKILESAPEEVTPFKSFILEEAEREGIKLVNFQCEKGKDLNGRSTAREKDSRKSSSNSSFIEIPFSCQGTGNYGAILRLSDRISSGKTLVSVDRFAISRTSMFAPLFGGKKVFLDKDKKKDEDLTMFDMHSFYIEGRILSPAPKHAEDK